jgi:flagellar hook assembly protein FlgD
VPKAGDVEARIFDIQGRLIRSFSKSYQQTGTHSFVWDSRGNSGIVVASGTYFCQVLFNGTALVKKIVLIK